MANDSGKISGDPIAPNSTGLYLAGTQGGENVRAPATYFSPDGPLMISASDEVTPIAVSEAAVTFRMPYAFRLTVITASLVTEQDSGQPFELDVKRWHNSAWGSVFSTLLTFNNGSRTTVGADVPAVISITDLEDDDEMRVDVTRIGSGLAAGLKVTLKGVRLS